MSTQISESQKSQIQALHSDWAKLRENFAVPAFASQRRGEEIFRQDIFEIADNVDIRKPVKATSHRKILGPLIVLMKSIAMRISKPIISVCFKRQLILNDHLLNIATRLADLEQRLKQLEEKN